MLDGDFAINSISSDSDEELRIVKSRGAVWGALALSLVVPVPQ